MNALLHKPRGGFLGSNNDGNDRRDDHDPNGNGPSRHRHGRKKRDESDSSSDDAEQSGLHRMKRKKEKKARRDSALSISNPMALGLKYLINEDASKAASVEKAVLLRAIKPGSITIEQVFKNPGLLRWDHPLILATTRRMFAHEIQYLMHRGKQNKAQQLSTIAAQLLFMMVDDTIHVSPDAALAAMNAFWDKDPSGFSILDRYQSQRDSYTNNPANRSLNIARLDGLCIGYNFHYEGCNNSDCQYGHYCAFHQSEKVQHPTMRCNDNPNKWKPKPNRSNNNNYNNRKGGRGKPRRNNNHYNNNRGWNNNNYYQQQQQYPPNQYPHQFQAQQPPYPYPFFPQFAANNPQGNKDRFFNPGGKK